MGPMVKIAVSPEHEAVGTHDDPCPVMLVFELQGIPRQKHTIIDSPNKLLEPLLIIHIQKSRCVPSGVAVVYGLASLLHTVE